MEQQDGTSISPTEELRAAEEEVADLEQRLSISRMRLTALRWREDNRQHRELQERLQKKS